MCTSGLISAQVSSAWELKLVSQAGSLGGIFKTSFSLPNRCLKVPAGLFKNSQKRQTLYINAYIRNRKVALTILRAGQQRRHRRKEQTSGLGGRRRGWMIWENSTETWILPYVKDNQWEFDGWRRAPKAGAVTTWRGWVGREVERGFRMEVTHVTNGRFILMYGKNHHNTVIILQRRKERKKALSRPCFPPSLKHFIFRLHPCSIHVGTFPGSGLEILSLWNETLIVPLLYLNF